MLLQGCGQNPGPFHLHSTILHAPIVSQWTMQKKERVGSFGQISWSRPGAGITPTLTGQNSVTCFMLTPVCKGRMWSSWLVRKEIMLIQYPAGICHEHADTWALSAHLTMADQTSDQMHLRALNILLCELSILFLDGIVTKFFLSTIHLSNL